MTIGCKVPKDLSSNISPYLYVSVLQLAILNLMFILTKSSAIVLVPKVRVSTCFVYLFLKFLELPIMLSDYT